MKTTKDQLINHYRKDCVTSLCHVTDSLYLVGLHNGGLILWNEQTDHLLFKICDDVVTSIKRVLTTNNYVFKTYKGVKVVTINDSVPQKFSIQHLLDAESKNYYNDSLQLQITDSHITIATTKNGGGFDMYTGSIKLIKVPIVAEMGGEG